MKVSTSHSSGSPMRRTHRTADRTGTTAVHSDFRVIPVGRKSERYEVMQSIGSAIGRFSPREIKQLRTHASIFWRVFKTLADNPDAKVRLIIEQPDDCDRPERQGRTPDILTGEAVQRVQTPEQQQALDHALTRARSRGAELGGAILQRPDMLSAEQMAERMATTRDTVNRWRKNRRLLGLKGPKRGFRYPAWQLSDRGAPFEALPAILEAAGDPWSAYRALTGRHPELGNITGLDALRQGNAPELIEIIAHFGEPFG